jgi:hypothetical protein
MDADCVPLGQGAGGRGVQVKVGAAAFPGGEAAQLKGPIFKRGQAQDVPAERADADPQVGGRGGPVVGDDEAGIGRAQCGADIEVAIKDI